jgi:hypothetical protein
VYSFSFLTSSLLLFFSLINFFQFILLVFFVKSLLVLLVMLVISYFLFINSCSYLYFMFLWAHSVVLFQNFLPTHFQHLLFFKVNNFFPMGEMTPNTRLTSLGFPLLLGLDCCCSLLSLPLL